MALGSTQATLAKRLQAAQARVTAEARSHIASASSNVPVSPLPTPPTPRNHKQPPAKPTPTPKPAKAPKKGRETGKGQAADGRANAADAPTLAARLRAQAENPAALAFVSDFQLEEIFSAMVANAATKGSTGAMDRQAIFRAAGLPFQGGVGARGGKGAGPGGAAVRARLETALRRVTRHSAATQEPDPAETDVETAA